MNKKYGEEYLDGYDDGEYEKDIEWKEKIKEILEEIVKLRVSTQKETGTFDYDEIYNDCIKIIMKLIKQYE